MERRMIQDGVEDECEVKAYRRKELLVMKKKQDGGGGGVRGKR